MKNTDWSHNYKKHFETMQDGIANQCTQHDREAKKWNDLNTIFMILFASLSVIMALNAPLGDISPWLVSIAAALNGGLLYTYSKMDPMAQKASHIKASSAKASISDRIQQELLQTPEKREDPDEFLSWINKDLGVVSDASPYLFVETVDVIESKNHSKPKCACCEEKCVCGDCEKCKKPDCACCEEKCDCGDCENCKQKTE